MSDLISRRELIKHFKAIQQEENVVGLEFVATIDEIKGQPTAYDVDKVSEKPIFDFNSSDTLSRFHCVCGKIIWVHHDIGTMDNNDAPNYCSNCGLKFDWNK